MNPNHYCDIERCKKLTEITEKSKTFGTQLQWYQMVGKPETLRLVQHLAPIDVQEEFVAWCPSVMEMLDVIPRDEKYQFTIHIREKWKDVFIHYEIGRDFYSKRCESTLPNALADLIFWLHENNYIKF